MSSQQCLANCAKACFSSLAQKRKRDGRKKQGGDAVDRTHSEWKTKTSGTKSKKSATGAKAKKKTVKKADIAKAKKGK